MSRSCGLVIMGFRFRSTHPTRLYARLLLRDMIQALKRATDREDVMTTLNRRMMLRGGAALAVAGAGFLRTPRTWAQANPLPEVQALLFDVFGTVVDWRNGVAREVERVLKPLGYSLDWLAFADAWRAEYQPGMDEIRTGRQSFVKLDIIHRRMLDRIKPRFGLEKLDEATQAELNLAWHRLDAWKDVGPGFARLR